MMVMFCSRAYFFTSLILASLRLANGMKSSPFCSPVKTRSGF